MGTKARGFLLFSFAFSSVLSSVPSKVIQLPNSFNNSSEIVRFSEHEVEKRASSSMGFNGMRGKKDSYLIDELDDPDKRAPMGFNGMRGKKDGYLDEPDKRAPMGFNGMRGKKDETEDYLVDETDKRAMGFNGMRGKKDEDPDKRASMGFNGMRGKKDDGEKRAPMGFNGMRGKKEDSDKRASMGFNGMRGKKEEYLVPISEVFGNDAGFYGISPDEYLSEGYFDDDDEQLDKRAMGFNGMRGRRFPQETWLEKRAPFAFQGTRGKKENDYNYKRAMGFLGMRGKKSPEIWRWDENEKRAPNSGFFGMRGKKAQSSGFFGMRGKKAPSAFVGIKGKREMDNEFQDINSLLNELTTKERIRRGTNWLRNSKKAKSAFFGIKGKKSSWGSSSGSGRSSI